MDLTNDALKACEHPPDNCEDILLAALLHDADDRKFFGGESRNAEEILTRVGASKERIEAIQRMIALVSFSKNQDDFGEAPIFAYYPRYSDRLEASGRVGIVRSYTYGRNNGRKPFEPQTARPKSREELYEAIKGRDEVYRHTGESLSMVDHFYDKILHIGCPEELRHIKFYREEFDRRQKEIEDFIIEFSVKDFEGIEDRLIQMENEFKGIVN